MIDQLAGDPRDLSQTAAEIARHGQYLLRGKAMAAMPAL
jgi:hypothetical protein